MSKDSNPWFFYYTLGAALFVSLVTGAYLVWRDKSGNVDRRATPITIAESVTHTSGGTHPQADQSSRENRELTFSKIQKAKL